MHLLNIYVQHVYEEPVIEEEEACPGDSSIERIMDLTGLINIYEIRRQSGDKQNSNSRPSIAFSAASSMIVTPSL